MIVLTEKEVWKILKPSFRKLIDINKKALASLHDENIAFVPPRISIPSISTSVGDCTLFKPALYTQKQQQEEEQGMHSALGVKVVSVRDGNSRMGKPIVPATIMMLDNVTGETKAVIAATYLTAARTAAGSAVATEVLCLHRLAKGIDVWNDNYPALELVCFGAGLQAQMHILALSKCRWSSDSDETLDFKKITIVNRSKERAEKLRDQIKNDIKTVRKGRLRDISVVLSSDKPNVENTLRSADIIVTATNSFNPLFSGDWLKEGAHIIGVGSYTNSMQEVDVESLRRSFVAYDSPGALDVGDLKNLANAKAKGTRACLLAELLNDNTSFTEEINNSSSSLDATFFKSVGTAIQDVATADFVIDEATESGLGVFIDM